MSSNPLPSPEDLARRTPFVVRRLSDLPRHPLPRGTGTVRDVWTHSAPRADHGWVLQLIELRGQSGALDTPPGSEQLTVGLSGPQVTIEGSTPGGRSSAGGVRLRRGQPLRHQAPAVEYRRPLVRTSGTSRVLTLSYRPDRYAPEFVFATAHEVATFPPDTRVAIVLQGALREEGVEVGPDTAIVRRGASPLAATSPGARLLLLTVAAL